MKTVWRRIHNWLDANAPEGYSHLRPGGSAEAIRAAEAATGLKLPAAAKASYRIHDGQGTAPALIGAEGRRFVPLRDVAGAGRPAAERAPGCAPCVPCAS